MPPKTKKDLKPEQLDNYLSKYRIRLEGCAPERRWPEQHHHHFSVISEIQGNRYNDYMKTRDDVSKKMQARERVRVKRLRDRVKMLREDVVVNEATWRDQIEKLIIEPFDEGVICDYCGNERWSSLYHAIALPQEIDYNERLARKRARRRMCECGSASILGQTQMDDRHDSDDEDHSMVFKSVLESTIEHIPEDRLQTSKIPMKPDRVVGLSKTPRYRQLLDSSPAELHSPFPRTPRLLYPFLVMEAKQDRSPGFRSIQTQTAFPLRRLLMMQHKLRIGQGRERLDPLVWFFACQAEEWRLYAATMNDLIEVSIFQLWQGVVSSQDSALQLLQVVDFVWTWARDIYRPKLRECLRGFDRTIRDVSQVSTNYFARSQSGSSTPIIRSSSAGLMDHIIDSWSWPRAPADPHRHLQFPQFAGSHPFLRWQNCHYNMAPWATQTTVQHPDIFAVSFRILEIPSDAEDFHQFFILLQQNGLEYAVLLNLLKFMRQMESSVFVDRRSLSGANFGWTTSELAEPFMADSKDKVKAFVFFRTFCQSESWQVRREFFCIFWSYTAEELLSNWTQTPSSIHVQNDRYPDMIRAVRQLLDLYGKLSLENALSGTTLVLANHGSREMNDQLHWEHPSEHIRENNYIGQYVSLFDTVARGNTSLNVYHRKDSTTVTTLDDFRIGAPPGCLAESSDGPETGDSILAIKPHSWPDQCPRFCLFVFPRSGFDDKLVLRRLLRDALESGKIHMSTRQLEEAEAKRAAVGMNNDESRVLKQWLRALKYVE